MPKPRTPLSRRSDGYDDDSNVTTLGITSGDDDEEEDEEDEEDEDDEDRGDDHDADDDPDEEDEDEEDDPDEEEEEDDEDEESEDDEEEEEEDDPDLDPEALAAIAAENGGMVPVGRLSEVIRQRDQAVQLVLEQQRQSQTVAAKKDDTPAFDMKAKLKERNAAILEGDEDKAQAIDLEIQEETSRNAIARATEASTQAALQVIEQNATQQVIRQLQKQHPELDDSKGNKKFDQDSLDAVIAMRDALMKRGMPMADALVRAARKICGEPVEAAAKVKNKDKGGKGGQPGKSMRQKMEALKRAKKQPPRTHAAGTGNRSSAERHEEEGDVLSERNMRRMSDHDKRVARGDFVGKKPRRG